MEAQPAEVVANGVTADPASFALAVGPALLAMRRLARRLAPNADPDDLVQDALARAWRKRALFDPDRGTTTTWLLAILADQARSSRRSRLRRLRVVDDVAELAADSVSLSTGEVDRDVDRDVDLERAIAQLTGRQHLAVQLHYFVGLSVAETATVMSCAAGTVKSTLSDARARLRALLGDDDD